MRKKSIIGFCLMRLDLKLSIDKEQKLDYYNLPQ